jgi:hypothetical protein
MLYDRVPERIVPSLRPYRTPADQATFARDPSVVSYVQERLTERHYRGIGEFHLLPGDATQGAPVAFAALGSGGGPLLHVHADAVALRQFLDLRTDDTVLWAHAGMSESPATIQRILDAYPNVWVELALRYDIAPGGRLDPTWAALFLRYPDRFMVGTDTWVPSQWTRLPGLMADVRTWLRQLPPQVATAIAYSNAERLLAPAGAVELVAMSDSEDPSTRGEILKASSPGPDQVRVDMDVVSIDGEHIGKVKEVRQTDFLLDRPLARDLWVPFDSVVEAGEHGGAFRRGPTQLSEVVLSVSAAHVDSQGWKHA